MNKDHTIPPIQKIFSILPANIIAKIIQVFLLDAITLLCFKGMKYDYRN
jgi:hypothetical protein